jgi:hypothetical protein
MPVRIDLSKVSSSELARELQRRRIVKVREQAAAEAVAAERLRVQRESKRQTRRAS